MTRINLLPSEIEAEKRKRRTNAVLVLASVVALALLILIWAILNVANSKIEAALRAQEAENKKIEAFISKIQHYQEDLDFLNERLKAIDDVKLGDPHWATILQDIAKIVPPEVELTSFTGDSAILNPENREALSRVLQSKEASIGLKIEGIARDFQEVTRLLTRLEKLPNLKGAWLVGSPRIEKSGLKLRSFQIEAWWNLEGLLGERAKEIMKASEKKETPPPEEEMLQQTSVKK